jgi:hypothetical protein
MAAHVPQPAMGSVGGRELASWYRSIAVRVRSVSGMALGNIGQKKQ